MKTIPHRRIVSALTAGMLAVSAGPAGAKSAAEVFAEVAPSVVVVLALDDKGETVAQGSGVVVGKNEVATNCHVIENAQSVAVRQAADSGGGETYRMDSRILTRDGERDLCLLFVDDLSVPPAAPVAAMGAAKGLAVGEEVYAIGAPKGLELSMSRGIVSQLRGVHGKRAAPLVQTDAAISPGSSGGGLFNADGELVGITTFKWRGESLNFAIPAEWVGELWGRMAALVALRGTPPPAGTETESALRKCGAWNGQLNASAIVDTEGNETVFHEDWKCERLHAETHLHTATRMNDSKSTRWLIANGADVNAKNNAGWTPLHAAAFQNASEAAAALLANGADVNSKTNAGWTPLYLAAFSREDASEAAAVLLANGAEVNAKDIAGWTPLYMVALRNASEAAAVLLANGAEVNVKGYDGETPLHLAALWNASEAAAVLLANGAEVNAKNNDGETPLDLAIREGHSKMQSLLKRHGGRCNIHC